MIISSTTSLCCFVMISPIVLWWFPQYRHVLLFVKRKITIKCKIEERRVSSVLIGFLSCLSFAFKIAPDVASAFRSLQTISMYLDHHRSLCEIDKRIIFLSALQAKLQIERMWLHQGPAGYKSGNRMTKFQNFFLLINFYETIGFISLQVISLINCF